MSRFAGHDRLLIINTVHQISRYARNFTRSGKISSVARNLMKVFDFMVVVMSNEVRHLKSGKQLQLKVVYLQYYIKKRGLDIFLFLLTRFKSACNNTSIEPEV